MEQTGTNIMAEAIICALAIHDIKTARPGQDITGSEQTINTAISAAVERGATDEFWQATATVLRELES